MFESPTVTFENGIVGITPRSIEGGPPGMGSPLLLNPRRTAVVVVDVQQYFLETPPFTAMREVVAPLVRFLPVARAAGITIVHVKTDFTPGLENAGRQGSRSRQMMESTRTGLVQGSRTAEIASELTPDPSDVVVTKTRFSGFWASDLDAVLRARDIDTLIFAGGTTTVCVESTLRDAMFLEYNALVLSDCTRDISPELHHSALARIEMFFGWICDSQDLIPALDAVNDTRSVATAKRPSAMTA